MNISKKRKIWFQRNEQAEELEEAGELDAALRLYEKNAAEGCDIRYTYEQLAIHYRRLERLEDEIDALNMAYAIEKKRGPTSNLVRLQKRIEISHDIIGREHAVDRSPAKRMVKQSEMADTVREKQKGCSSVLVLIAVTIAGYLMY